ncbi:benzoate 4-monooxygenase cytochrome P450 [Colletotrichum karsti]|uniref:Benzoate 4-monooxygenase cytochrome P450 n=1 Tax=Colletotrichum karsti TaxID=1095194 RepID=A0A9P6HXA3_9PEZI|nr:benzoate 4-monooxygenase cytochrome P450 [Colletotrichum karsti]KAF9869991.1 benzoate 4-monooxygenase cytochrome P450 [Colletotrichum karsti]
MALISPLSPWSLGQQLGLAVLVFTVAVVSVIVYGCFFHPIAHIPGPFLAKFSPLWIMRALHRMRFNSELQALHQRYGPVVRVGPNEVSFASLEAETAIYAKQEDGRFSKDGTFLTLFSDLVLNAPTLITIPDPALHKKLHKVIQQAFTPQALARQEPIQKLHIDMAMSEVEELAQKGGAVDIADTLETMFWEIIGDLAFGEPLMSGKRPTYESLKQLGKSTMPMVEALSFFLAMPGIASLLESARSLVTALPFPSQLSKLVPSSKLRDCVDRQDGREDFLTAIMGSEKQGLTLDADAFFSNAMGLTLAGYQTTATTLAATFYHILRYPDAYNRVCFEIRSNFTNEEDITGERLARLPFLSACIRETLRLLPPANGKTAQRTAPSCTIDGVHIPAGTTVSADLYTIQRSPEYFADPATFRPERWLDGVEDTEFRADNRTAYRPFLIGSRACIGRHMAQQSIRLIVGKLLWRYDLELLDRDGFIWERDAGSSLIYTEYKVMASEAIRHTRPNHEVAVYAESDTDDEFKQPARKKTKRERANSSRSTTITPDRGNVSQQRPMRRSKFPLLSLPIEIRYMIYNSSTPSDEFLIVNRDPGPYKPIPRQIYGNKVIHNLHKTCRTISSETREIIYRRRFIVHDMKTLRAWLDMIGPQNRQQLRSIRLSRPRVSSEIRCKRVASAVSREGRDQLAYRRQSRKLSRLLLDCDNLQNLELNFRYCFYSLPPLSLGHTTCLRERYAAEIMYEDFWEFFHHRLDRGDSPESLCWILKAARNNFHALPGLPSPDVTADERQWDCSEHIVAEYVMLLLWKDIELRGGPKSDPERKLPPSATLMRCQKWNNQDLQ